jgi:hypothetical protein
MPLKRPVSASQQSEKTSRLVANLRPKRAHKVRHSGLRHNSNASLGKFCLQVAMERPKGDSILIELVEYSPPQTQARHPSSASDASARWSHVGPAVLPQAHASNTSPLHVYAHQLRDIRNMCQRSIYSCYIGARTINTRMLCTPAYASSVPAECSSYRPGSSVPLTDAQLDQPLRSEQAGTVWSCSRGRIWSASRRTDLRPVRQCMARCMLWSELHQLQCCHGPGT